MNETIGALGPPPQVHQSPGFPHDQGVGRQQDEEPFFPPVHIQSRPTRQPSSRDGDGQSYLPDARVGQQGGEATSLPLVEPAEGTPTVDGVQTLNQGSRAESSSIEVDTEEVAINDDASEGEEEDGDIEDEEEQAPEPPPHQPPRSPLRETHALPCVHELVCRQLSATLLQGPTALSLEELLQPVG